MPAEERLGEDLIEVLLNKSAQDTGHYQIYKRHTQVSAIDFIDHVIERFPFRIHTNRTDNGHEWQSGFHWHVEDFEIRHVYIKPRTPRLNGKVERSHGTDQREFYQLLEYKDDVDLEAKLKPWEDFYNLHRQRWTPFFGQPDGRFKVDWCFIRPLFKTSS